MQKPLELTKTQQRHTLSAKKKKQQPSLKSALAQPFPRYWPQISANESRELFNLLTDVKTAAPNHFAHKKSDPPCPITFGLSSTLRRIKNGMSRILVLSADLKPRYVINQIILLALARNETVHIFCVPNLEHEMRSLVDFACFAFAIGDVEMSPWKQVFAWCKTMTIERYPVPELIRAYFDAHRRRTSSKNETIPMETESVVAIADVPLSHVHLVRPSAAPERRAFIPTNAINLKPMSFGVTSLGKIKSDFISLDTFDSDDNSSRPIDSMQSPLVAATPMRPNGNKSVESTSYSERYQSAKIKRYSGNPAKRKNDGSAKLPRDQKKELRLARKAMRKAKKNK